MRHLTTPPLRAVHSAALRVLGAGSYALRARPEDDRAMWPALAERCRRVLPARLAWAAKRTQTPSVAANPTPGGLATT